MSRTMLFVVLILGWNSFPDTAAADLRVWTLTDSFFRWNPDPKAYDPPYSRFRNDR